MKLIYKKLMVSLVAITLMVCLAGIGWLWIMWEIGELGNWGLETGYYGQLNRVTHVLQQMPNVAITNHWENDDVTLEDFTFFLLVDQTNSVRIDFSEDSPQMKERNKEKIRTFIGEQIRKARTSTSGVRSARGGPRATEA